MMEMPSTNSIAKEIKSGLRECARHDRARTALPAACYRDTNWLAQEVRHLFHGGWIGLGRADRWRKAGDFETIEVAGAQIIVVRDRDDKLAAFSNACRHRGARLMTGRGNCRGIRCPFHAWAYRLDGSLAAAPQMEDAQEFDKSKLGLRRFAIEERAGFAFLNLTEAPVPIDDWLGDFTSLHGPWQFGKLVSTRRREFEVNCNWKPFLEVFNEYYHLPFVHAGSLGGLYDPPDEPETVDGAFISQFGATRGTGALLKDEQEKALPAAPWVEGRNRNGVRYTWAFPNMAFAAGPESLWIYDVLPLATNRTRVGMTACFAPDVAEAADFEDRVQPYYERLDAAIAEDIEMLEEQQIGLNSPFADTGPFSPLLEANVSRFASWYSHQFDLSN